MTNRAEFEKWREQLRNLPPQERAAKLRELRQGSARLLLSEQDRLARRKEIQHRLKTQIEQLQKKKTDGTITRAESRRLDRLEQIAGRPNANAETPAAELK
jgi:hypothetical protein